MIGVPQLIAERSLKCNGQVQRVAVYSPIDQSITLKEGVLHGRFCTYRFDQNPPGEFQVLVNRANVRLEDTDVAEKIDWWLPRAGLMIVIRIVCGDLEVSDPLMIAVHPHRVEDDPQKDDMSTFRKRCRFDVLHVISHRLDTQGESNNISLPEIQASSLATRLYEVEDIRSAMKYWSQRGILTNRTLDDHAIIDENLDEEVQELLDGYDWEECSTGASQNIGRSETTPDIVPNLCSSKNSAPKVFISYRRADTADVTGRIRDRLVAHLGTDNVFIDFESITLGKDFRDAIALAVTACDAVLVVMCPSWHAIVDENGRRRLHQENDPVRVELETALREGKRVIPLLAGGAVMPAAGDLPQSIRSIAFLNALRVRPDPDFDNDMNVLLRALEREDKAV